jgi:MFS transporter, DHA1 family, multidrug resistance protein
MAEERRVPMNGSGGAPADPSAAAEWQKTLWVMVGIQFIMTMAFSVLSPIMPLLLPELGVETESAVDLWAGILDRRYVFCRGLRFAGLGRVADRHSRKLMLLRSSLAIGLFTALMGVAVNVWQFFAFRALMGVFAGFSSAAIALVASQVPEGRLGYALGWLSTGQLVGSLVGPLIGGVLADLTGSYRIPFYCTSATILLSLGLVWFGVQERFAARPRRAAEAQFSVVLSRWRPRRSCWRCFSC